MNFSKPERIKSNSLEDTPVNSSKNWSKQKKSNALNNDSKSCFNYCLYLLARRDYSNYKIRKKLAQREYSQEIIEETIRKLLELKYLRETEYIKGQIKKYISRSCSNYYIQRKMSQEKISITNDDIDLVRSDLQSSEDMNIKSLVEKKLRLINLNELNYSDKIKLKSKIFRYLIGKGYSIDQINGSGYKMYFSDNNL